MAGKKEAKAVTSESVSESKSLEVNKDGLAEVTLVKDHGVDLKGSKLLRHPNTAQMLIDSKIAK